MKESVLFLDMFSAYTPPEELQSCLSQAAVLAAQIDPVQRFVLIDLYCHTYLTQKQVQQMLQ